VTATGVCLLERRAVDGSASPAYTAGSARSPAAICLRRCA